MRTLFIAFLIGVSIVPGCDCNEDEKPDLQIPLSLNPAYFGYSQVFIANFNTPVISYNSITGCQASPPGPFYIFGNAPFENEFYSVTRVEFFNGFPQPVTHFWNKNIMPPCFATLDSGEEVVVYKLVLNMGNVSTKYTKKSQGNSKTRSVVIKKDAQGSRMIKEEDAETPVIPARGYALINSRFRFDGTGLYEIRFDADIKGDIKEYDETNNDNTVEVVDMKE